MSVLNYLITKLETGLITFINAVTLANRDYPYHDYATFDEECADLKYMVGANQLHGHGDQRKPFVSKSTLIFATEDMIVRFNSTNNVAVLILADTWYEFKSNIYQVFFTPNAQPTTWDIYFYFEGVLSNEQRSPQ